MRCSRSVFPNSEQQAGSIGRYNKAAVAEPFAWALLRRMHMAACQDWVGDWSWCDEHVKEACQQALPHIF